MVCVYLTKIQQETDIFCLLVTHFVTLGAGGNPWRCRYAAPGVLVVVGTQPAFTPMSSLEPPLMDLRISVTYIL